jgi:hypothetical protein
MIHSITQVVDGGGMMKRLYPEHQITNYIDVKSIENTRRRYRRSEGK